MKKLYEENIKIHDDQKLSENVFKVRITLSVIAILSCITVMVSTAFALFSSNLTQEFTMQAAVWDIVVEATGFGKVSEVYTCPQTEGEMHEFIISPRGSATRGYCIIEITDLEGRTDRYYTSSFKNDITVTIQAVAGCEIRFTPRWGKPGNYDIAETVDGIIYHSYTEPEEPSEEGETSESSAGAESGEVPSDGSGNDLNQASSRENESSSDEFEASDSETESSDSTEFSEENTEDLSSESTPTDSQESSSSPDVNHSTESNNSSEESSAPEQSSGESSSSSSDSSSSSSNDSSSAGSSSSSSESSSSSVDSSSSESSSSSGGGESSSSAPSGDGGSVE